MRKSLGNVYDTVVHQGNLARNTATRLLVLPLMIPSRTVYLPRQEDQ